MAGSPVRHEEEWLFLIVIDSHVADYMAPKISGVEDIRTLH